MTEKNDSVKRERVPRAFAPKPTLGIVPALTSDQSAFAVVGLTPGQFRETVRKYNIPHKKCGSRLLVATDDLIAFVRSVSSVDAAMTVPEVRDEQPETQDEVLARIGLRRKSA